MITICIGMNWTSIMLVHQGVNIPLNAGCGPTIQLLPQATQMLKDLFLETATKVFVMMMQWVSQAVIAVIISEKHK